MSSILDDTKKTLGIDFSYTAFDLDIITHINAAFSTLNQLGVGSVDGFFIEDGSEEWDAIAVPANQLHPIKTYLYLKVRMVFDPPGTSYLIEAMDRQIRELEWRISCFREMAAYPLDDLLVNRESA